MNARGQAIRNWLSVGMVMPPLGDWHHQVDYWHFLTSNQIGGLAAQDGLGAAQMRFQFIERRFDFPALVIEGRQFLGWGLLVI